MYAYKIIESGDFQSVSSKLFNIKSGLQIDDKEKYYVSYAEWLNSLIIDVINGKIEFVIAADEYRTLAYMSFGKNNSTIDVKEICAIKEIEKLEDIVCGLLKFAADNCSKKEKIKFIVFHNDDILISKCEFLKFCDTQGNNSRYYYLQ